MSSHGVIEFLYTRSVGMSSTEASAATPVEGASTHRYEELL